MTDHPLRVVFVLDEVARATAGTEQQLLLLLKHLDRSRVSPSVVVFRSSPVTDGWPIADCPVTVLGLTRIASASGLGKLLALRTHLREHHAQVVHVLFNDAAIVAPPVAGSLGLPVVGARRDVGFWHTKVTRRLVRVSNRFVRTMAVNSRAVRDAVIDNEAFPADRIEVIPNALDETRLRPPAAALRAQLGLPTSAVLIGIVANLNPWKRHRDVLQALAQVRAAGHDAHLVLVGGGDEEQALRALAAELGLSPAVHFMGPLRDPLPIVKALDVAVLASESEGASNALLEYLACGRAVVASACEANVEMTEQAAWMRTYPVGDVDALAGSLRGILDNPEAYTPTESQVNAFVHSHGIDVMVARYTDLYARSAAGADRSAS